ncbi:MAG: toxin-antitoxin system YwqK family antitoxin [Hyphomicrobiales bacterium]
MNCRKYFILIILSFVVSSAFSQSERENYIDSKGKRQGAWKGYDPMGALKFVGQFKDDKPYGKFTYYYTNGKTKAVTQFAPNGKDATTELFHKNGVIMARGKYLNQQREGEWRFYSDYDSALISTEHYIDGKREGKIITYYPESGNIAEEINYKDDWEEGPFKRFFDSGQVKAEGQYVRGRQVGVVKHYYADGKVSIQGQYQKGLKSGIWSFYDEKGELWKKDKYKNGRLIDSKIYKEPKEEEMKKIDEKDVFKDIPKSNDK